GVERRFVPCTTAVASRTDHLFVNFYFFLDSIGDFAQIQFDFDAQIGSASHSTTASATAATKETFKRTASTENISKLTEDIFHIHTPTTEASCAPRSGVTKLVVALPFF